MSKLSILLFFTFCLSANILAQSQAILKGKVTEAKTGDDAINAYVKLSQNGVTKTTVATDFEGNYSINIEAGTYDVEVSYVGLKTFFGKNVLLILGKTTTFDTKLEVDTKLDIGIVCGGYRYKIPLTQQDNTTSGAAYSSEQISRSPR